MTKFKKGDLFTVIPIIPVEESKPDPWDEFDDKKKEKKKSNLNSSIYEFLEEDVLNPFCSVVRALKLSLTIDDDKNLVLDYQGLDKVDSFVVNEYEFYPYTNKKIGVQSKTSRRKKK